MQNKKIHINKYTKEIYFINLNSSKQRCAETKKELAKHAIRAKRFPGIHGLDLNQEEMIKNKYILRKFKPGSLGCFLSHVRLWSLIKKSNENFGLIFEDDIVIDEKFHEKFNKYFEQVPSDWDMVWLGSGKNLSGEKITSHILKGYNWAKDKTKDWNNRTHAYLIKKKSIDKIKKTILPIKNPDIDIAIRENLNSVIKGYFFVDYVVNSNTKFKSDRKHINKKIL